MDHDFRQNEGDTEWAEMGLSREADPGGLGTLMTWLKMIRLDDPSVIGRNNS